MWCKLKEKYIVIRIIILSMLAKNITRLRINNSSTLYTFLQKPVCHTEVFIVCAWKCQWLTTVERSSINAMSLGDLGAQTFHAVRSHSITRYTHNNWCPRIVGEKWPRNDT
uniref:Putative secreted protein n=1 Tax=Ixodes ricinus TaxID=34613 RepID=A0A6B0UJG4_IXORI